MRKLVNKVKEKIENDPPSYHYIITIHCSEKGSLTLTLLQCPQLSLLALLNYTHIFAHSYTLSLIMLEI